MALAPDVVSAVPGSAFGIAPNTLYYLVLYSVVIAVRFFKLRKDEDGPGWHKHTRREVFHVGLEVVYTSSGLVILLLNDLRDFAPFIFVAYVLVVLASSQMESMEEKFTPNQVFGTHLVILIAVIATTVVYFQGKQNRAMEVHDRSKAPSHYRVAIPYQDFGLREHVGAAFGARELVYITDVTATDPFDARTNARAQMAKEIVPFETNRKKANPNSVVPYLDRIIVTQLD